MTTTKSQIVLSCGCVRLCADVCGLVWLCAGMCGCVQMCVGVCGFVEGIFRIPTGDLSPNISEL